MRLAEIGHSAAAGAAVFVNQRRVSLELVSLTRSPRCHAAKPSAERPTMLDLIINLDQREGRSAWRCQRRCLPAPTRWSN